MQTLMFDVVVIGGGVVGIAVARRLARNSQGVLLLEREPKIGMGISSRNSEVIHSGIYYAKGSLKARLCVAGKECLYRYCDEKSVAHKRIGKLIVATTDNEAERLVDYREKGIGNGVDDLQLLDASDVKAMEPAVSAVAGLFSPGTGIVDSHALMDSLLHDFEAAGGLHVPHSPILNGEILPDGGGICIHVGGKDPCQVTANRVVNAAGLGAQSVACSIKGFPMKKVPSLHYAIGHYYTLTGRAPFERLVYPVASAGGLGVHLTLDLAGQARFGPDISWRDSEDYSFDDTRRGAFIEAIRRYWPGLTAESLSPGYTGIRPKLWGPDRPEQDFMIQGSVDHGIPGLVNLFGIESPGLTASMAIAEYVADLLFPNQPRFKRRIDSPVPLLSGD